MCAPAAISRALAGKRALGRRLVAAERQVGDDERAFAAGGDAARVVAHFGELHRQRRGVALHHHAERVADQQHVDPGGVEHAREAGVVAGQHGDLLALAAQGLEGGKRDGFVHSELSGSVIASEARQSGNGPKLMHVSRIAASLRSSQ
jgi:hypothetical protein